MFSHYLSERVSGLPDTQMAEIIKKAAEDKSIISLGPGEPDFSPPKSVVAETGKAARQGYTHYSPPQGRTELLEAIAKKLEKENRVFLKEPGKQVMVTTGSTEALILATMSMVDSGESMLIPNPGFLAYRPTVELMEGFARPYSLTPENGFQIQKEELERIVTKRTHSIMVNSPSNPTGSVYSKKTLEEVCDFAVEHDLMVLSDEAYEHFVYGKKHISMASLNGMEERVLTFHSFSKTYAMAGYRIGYCAGPKWVIQAMTKAHLYTSVSPNTISQRCALAALKAPKKEINRMRDEYEKRRRYILGEIKKIPYLHIEKDPEGAFYAFPKITNGMDGVSLAKVLLDKSKVMVVPGIEFGSEGKNFIRMSYATALPKIRVAMQKLREAKV